MEYKTSAAQRRANYNYDETHERVNCRFAKGTKERIKSLIYFFNDTANIEVDALPLNDAILISQDAAKG